ncbi:nitroreductase/quinone reductase family protein [Homoserinibacter sp. YIM 151385]|uniref:nitroreductase/quinone reductase family protein n=1 Tax=Homoserinibacter sp. YIM 151385 TaxID=2985506 RepID=UPI0022F0DAA7|nr:nitroreductase/quinone reductase family protein [Homoserinibacter sp. YIM 151385]WBU37206.1 nitroreductase/quinone reductase family protein [Homoserinibacter sp. YIM 151385]
MSGFNEQIAAEFRANGGRVARFGDALVILHTTGARSGEPRENPVMGLPDGDGWIIPASAAGSPKDPAWAHNLRAHPDIEIEFAGADGVETAEVRAEQLEDPAWAAAWDRFTSASDGFREYETRTQGRRIPVFRLARR